VLQADNAYVYASGSTFLLSLRDDLENLSEIKASTQKAVYKAELLKDFPFLKPTNSIFPEGFAAHLPHKFPDPKEMKVKKIPTIKIKIARGVFRQEFAKLLKESLRDSGIDADFVEVDPQVFKQGIKESGYDGMIATPYLDTLDEVNKTKGYFSGYWNFFPKPTPKLMSILAEASAQTDRDARIQKLKLFYRELIHSHNLVPLFFAPSIVLVSKDVSRDRLEYFGNTIKFWQFFPK
jgi:ABC-type transport system substrate-binding protein